MDLPRVDADRALVDAALAGDREAVDDLVRRHQSAVLGLVRALTGQAEDAEDLAQEVFVRAWRSLGTFRGDSMFRTWLHRVAVNVVHTALGQHARARRYLTSRSDTAPEPSSAAPPVDGQLVRRQIIERALGSLPEELRVAVTLRDVQGLEYREIAALLGVPVGTVESRIFRARQRLKPLLAPLLSGRL